MPALNVTVVPKAGREPSGEMDRESISRDRLRYRFLLGSLVSGIALATTMFSISLNISEEPRELEQSGSANAEPRRTAQKFVKKMQVLENYTLSEEEETESECARPQLSEIRLTHESSWNSVYSFDESVANGSLGSVVLNGEDVLWKNGSSRISSAVQRYHHSAKSAFAGVQHSYSTTDVWQIMDCENNLVAAVKATGFHRCHVMALLHLSLCCWESSNFSIHDQGGDHVGILALRRHHEFDLLSLTDEKAANTIATVQAIAKKLSTIEAHVEAASLDSVPGDPRVLTALMVKVHQQIVAVENRAAVNSVTMPILAFCAAYVVFAACMVLCCRGGEKSLHGALVINIIVVVLVGIGTLLAQAYLTPGE